MIMCRECNEFWHTNNPTRQQHTVAELEKNEVSSDSTNVPSDTTKPCSSISAETDVFESGFFDFESDNECYESSRDLEEMCRIATLAEQFSLTSFKPFQKTVIDGCLRGKDTIVVHPTGSGKSLCFQFPAAYSGKMTLVITPTISLMKDQTDQLIEKGISTTFLGTAQPDKSLEKRIFQGNTDVKVLFVTPEWLFSSNKLSLVKEMALTGKIGLIAVDEAHLIFDWQTFRGKYWDV